MVYKTPVPCQGVLMSHPPHSPGARRNCQVLLSTLQLLEQKFQLYGLSDVLVDYYFNLIADGDLAEYATSTGLNNVAFVH